MSSIKHTLLGDVLSEEGRLGDFKFQDSILLEYMLEISQNLKRHTQLGFHVSIVSINELPELWVLSKRTSPISLTKIHHGNMVLLYSTQDLLFIINRENESYRQNL